MRASYVALALSLLFCSISLLLADDTVKIIIGNKERFRLAVLPFRAPDELHRSLDPLALYLTDCLNRKVEIVVALDYDDLENLFQRDLVQAGWFTTNLDVKNICRPKSVLPFRRRGAIVVRTDSQLKEIEDLKGKAVAFVDRRSQSGFVLPNKLLHAAGLEPARDFSKIIFAGSHDYGLDLLARKECAAAAVGLFSIDAYRRRTDPSKVELTIIGRTEPVPLDPIVVKGNCEEWLANKLRDSLLAMSDKEGAARAMEALREGLNIGGFVASSKAPR